MATSERKHLLPSEGFGVIKEYSVEDDNDCEIAEEVEEVPVCCSHRLLIIICCTLSVTITYAAQSSLSAAMVCMIEDKDLHQDIDFHDNITLENTTAFIFNMTAANDTRVHDEKWLFTWDKSKQGLAISSFFMGYYVSQIPSSIAAARFGPKRVVVVSLILVSLFQGLAVPAAYYGIGWLYADRVITGIFDGFLYAPTFALAGQWAPRHETSLLFGVVGMGMELGNVLSYAASLLACEIEVQKGWPVVFYIIAGLGLVVAVLFMLIVSDSPFNNRYVSKKEVKYFASFIQKRQPTPEEALTRVPVKEILTSKCVWAIVVSQIGSDWLYYFFVTMEPTFLQDVIKLSSFQVNLLSGLPFLGIIPTIYLSGYLCDKLVTKDIISNTKIRKINDFICKIFPSAILVGLGFLPQGSTAAAFVLNLLGVMCMGFSYVSWMANPVDLAPAYTGFIVGICELGAIWVAIVVPIAFDDITVDKTREEWQLVFYITAGLQVFCFLFYAIFASGELQPWALSSSKESYDELDGQVGINQPMLGDGMKSKPTSRASAKQNGAEEDEAQNLLTSLSLSLGGFRGTSSYEASARRDAEKRQQEGDVGSSTVVVCGPALTKTPLQSGLMSLSNNVGHHNLLYAASIDGLIGPKDGSGYYIPNTAVLITKPLPPEGGFHMLGFESEPYIESDDDTWQKAATRSLPSILTRSVSHGHGDFDIHSAVLSPLASGQFDDEVSSDSSRNIKSLAAEIAEALSVHSLNELTENVGNVKITTEGATTKDEIKQSLDNKRQGKNDKSKVLTRWQNFMKKSSEPKKNLDNKKSKSCKNVKQGRNSSDKSALQREQAGPSAEKDPHLNCEDTSSIMVSSEECIDSMDTGAVKDKNGDSKMKNDSAKEVSRKTTQKDAKQRAGLVRRIFSFGRSKSDFDLSLPSEETFVFVTDDDIQGDSKTESFMNKSFDSARSLRESQSHRQGLRIVKKAEKTKIKSTDDDEQVLFANPYKKTQS